MGTTLHTLAPNRGATHKKKRVGRGPGSGYGKTAGRGQKGQKARAGHHGARVGFEGGQMPMQRRLPKRGFSNPFRVEAHPVNLGALAAKLGAGSVPDVIDPTVMRQLGLVPKKAKIIKVLGQGEFALAVTVRAHRFSKSAAAKIQQAGGTVEVIASGGTAQAGPAAPGAPAGDTPAQSMTPPAAKPATTDAPPSAEASPAAQSVEPSGSAEANAEEEPSAE